MDVFYLSALKLCRLSISSMMFSWRGLRRLIPRKINGFGQGDMLHHTIPVIAALSFDMGMGIPMIGDRFSVGISCRFKGKRRSSGRNIFSGMERCLSCGN
jgi:hypothetical protein